MRSLTAPEPVAIRPTRRIVRCISNAATAGTPLVLDTLEQEQHRVAAPFDHPAPKS